jgi:hypothetical protein
MQITEAGMLWECAKSNKATTPSGEKIRYALLMGHVAGEDETIILSIHDRDDREWLDEVDVIHRRITLPDPTFRIYDWSKDTNTWRQRLEDT